LRALRIGLISMLMLRNRLFEKGPHFTEIRRLTLPVSVFFY